MRLTRLAAVASVAGLALAGFALGEVPPVKPPAEPGLWSQFALWIATQQRELYGALRAALKGLEEGHAAALATLLALSFGYGVFHAAGPGHGKAIIASYLAANRDGVARGVALSAASSMAQAVTAIAIVGVLAIALDMAHRTVLRDAIWIERASFALAVALGLYLIGSAIYEAITKRHVHLFHAHGPEHVHGPGCGHDHARKPAPAHAHAGDAHDHAHDHGHAHRHDHAHDHGHSHGPACGHGAAPAAALREPFWSWKSAALIGSIGLRPCAGAIIVLLFSLTMGVFWAGVLAAFAMAAGTAIIVAAIAVFTVAARAGAARLAQGGGDGWSRVFFLTVRALGGAVLVIFGATLLMTPAAVTPFGAMPGT